jgi:hypothetical protein
MKRKHNSIKFFLFILSVLILESTAIDFNKQHLNDLVKHGDRQFTKVYAETPDSDVFLNSDVQHTFPSKFVNYTEIILNYFNNWNENTFLESNVNGQLTETIRENHNEKEISLREFFEQKDQYTFETRAQFKIPLALR